MWMCIADARLKYPWAGHVKGSSTCFNVVQQFLSRDAASALMWRCLRGHVRQRRLDA